MLQALFPTLSLYFARAKSHAWCVLVLGTFPFSSSCRTVSTTHPQCLQTYASSWSCCVLCRSSQSPSAYCLVEISRPARCPGTDMRKKPVVNIPFTPTRPISNRCCRFLSWVQQSPLVFVYYIFTLPGLIISVPIPLCFIMLPYIL